MSFLIDTDMVSLSERKRVHPKVAAWMQEHEGESFLSVVTIAELQYGLLNAPDAHKPSLQEWINGIRSDFAHATEPLTEAVLVRWKQMLLEMRRKNRSMTCEDSLIAATALHRGHVVATLNESHFAPSGVKLVNPMK